MSGRWAWLFDVGSTFTKLTVVDLDQPLRRHRAQAPTTVATDVREGFGAAVAAIESAGGPRFADAAHRAASSSAAGGLALVVSGLVPRLSAHAGRIAALGAGAKLVATHAYRLTAADLDALRAARPDVVLLTGGTDGGDRATLLENARTLAGWRGCPTVVVAGNRDAADEAAGLLRDGGVRATVVPNILPALDRLVVEPTRAAIRDEFLANIVRAKGIDRLADQLDAPILPTPGVVLDGVRLLAERAFGGALLAFEVGGATTNVHSWSTAEPAQGVVRRGLAEPPLKRTVEGDLGVRWNAETIAELAGADWFERDGPAALWGDAEAAPALDRERVAAYVARVAAAPATLPADDAERALDALLATYAARSAIARHCGRQREVTLPEGPVLVQEGKDLRDVGVVIATGGSVIAAADPVGLTRAALTCEDPFSLVPTAPRALVDRDYLLYATGLLADAHPDVAVELAVGSLERTAASSPA